MRPAKFLEAFSNWSKSNFHENRGRKRLKLETKQIIYDEWISNSVPPVDCRNGRECMKIKRNIFMQIYNKLENFSWNNVTAKTKRMVFGQWNVALIIVRTVKKK